MQVTTVSNKLDGKSDKEWDIYIATNCVTQNSYQLQRQKE